MTLETYAPFLDAATQANQAYLDAVLQTAPRGADGSFRAAGIAAAVPLLKVADDASEPGANPLSDSPTIDAAASLTRWIQTSLLLAGVQDCGLHQPDAATAPVTFFHPEVLSTSLLAAAHITDGMGEQVAQAGIDPVLATWTADWMAAAVAHARPEDRDQIAWQGLGHVWLSAVSLRMLQWAAA